MHPRGVAFRGLCDANERAIQCMQGVKCIQCVHLTLMLQCSVQDQGIMQGCCRKLQRSRNLASACAPFSPDHAGPRPPGPSGAEQGARATASARAAARGPGGSAPAPVRGVSAGRGVAVVAGVTEAPLARLEGAASSRSDAFPTSVASPILGPTSGHLGNARSRRPPSRARLLEPPLPPGAHSCQRSGLAIFSQGTRAAPIMKTTALLTWYGPLSAEDVTVAHTGTTALLVLAVAMRLKAYRRRQVVAEHTARRVGRALPPGGENAGALRRRVSRLSA
jgi:hypothetical protein